ncbi:alpha/beta fold hydrolase [Glaciecola siphonariae]|uniref:Alpha/beta fold hydrolase n=1 Tax=Glaciecola siphonariae TaxID=521012 RepID=A0ABV9LSF6_9ALTE
MTSQTMYILMLLLVCLGGVVYVLFISRSKRIGRFLYTRAMSLERTKAGLSTSTHTINGVPISCYANFSLSDSQNNTPTKADKRPVLLLLHGFSANKCIWHRFAMQAKKDYRLIIPDMLGHGDTPYSASQSYSTEQQADMLQALLDMLLVDKCMVIGNSMGGMIAMKLMQRQPMRFIKAILLDPAGAKTDFALGMQATGANPFLHKNMQHFFNMYNRTMAAPPFFPPCVLHYIGHHEYLQKDRQLSHMFRDFFNLNDFFDKPIKVDSNALMLVWGEEDGLVPVSDAAYWTELTACKPLIYANVGHMPMIEIPQKCYRDCKEFLEKPVR